jgi:putative transposon-encoded protein
MADIIPFICNPKAKVIMKDGKYEGIEIDGIKLNRFDLLALASETAFDDEKLAWQIMNIASIMFHPQDDKTFNVLYGAVAMDIARKNYVTEASLYPLFEKAVKKLFGNNAEIVKKSNNPKHQPDAWVRIENQYIPVEIKLHSFDKKALSQLQRYMNFYNCKQGIAVGNSLMVDLPENIIFISINELEEVK